MSPSPRSTATRRGTPPTTPPDAPTLIKLLDTFPAGEAGRVGMDADRLRAALGLR